MYPFNATCTYKRHNDINVQIDIDGVSTIKDEPGSAWEGVYGNIKVGVVISDLNGEEIINTWLYHRINAEQVIDDLQELIARDMDFIKRHPELEDSVAYDLRDRIIVSQTLQMALRGLSDHNGKRIKVPFPEPVHYKNRTIFWEALPPIDFDADYYAENDNDPIIEKDDSLIQW